TCRVPSATVSVRGARAGRARRRRRGPWVGRVFCVTWISLRKQLFYGLCRLRQRAFQRKAKIRPRTLGQQLERGAVRIGQFPRDVEAKTRATRARREERLEDIGPGICGGCRGVVVARREHSI